MGFDISLYMVVGFERACPGAHGQAPSCLLSCAPVGAPARVQGQSLVELVCGNTVRTISLGVAVVCTSAKCDKVCSACSRLQWPTLALAVGHNELRKAALGRHLHAP